MKGLDNRFEKLRHQFADQIMNFIDSLHHIQQQQQPQNSNEVDMKSSASNTNNNAGMMTLSSTPASTLRRPVMTPPPPPKSLMKTVSCSLVPIFSSSPSSAPFFSLVLLLIETHFLQIPLQCFYKSKKLIEIPKKGMTFEELKVRVEKVFGVSGLVIKYRTSSSSKVEEIKSTADIASAIEDGVTTLYVNLPGELNEHEPASSTRASTLRMPHVPDAQKIVQILQAAEKGLLEELQQHLQYPKHKHQSDGSGSDSSSPQPPPPSSWINCCDSEGKTPLHLAAINDHVTVVQWLLEQGADCNACDKAGWTPLHSAACAKNEKVINTLLAHKSIKGIHDIPFLF